ncbi:MAG TPA: hypothetical protein VEL28_14215 [Candidatus Binatia bacterium]|nr:hypothetical protein [Candidatus Binatia bacterium]
MLLIGSAAVRGDSAAALLELTGTWAFDDVLQVTFPLNVVVSQGSTFARFPAGAPARSGSYAGLSDGLGTGEIDALEKAGASDPAAAIIHIDGHTMKVALPPVFEAGPVRVLLYVRLPGEGTFLSNVVTPQVAP